MMLDVVRARANADLLCSPSDLTSTCSLDVTLLAECVDGASISCLELASKVVHASLR